MRRIRLAGALLGSFLSCLLALVAIQASFPYAFVAHLEVGAAFGPGARPIDYSDPRPYLLVALCLQFAELALEHLSRLAVRRYEVVTVRRYEVVVKVDLTISEERNSA